ncbi:MAG TPA: bifunctional molybdenum cofactor guanylyltransferase MobA/molybdopterin-guanine dinucleotide biosynthesis adaptor protein MobB [Geobacteraceae bacterium]
MPLGITGVILVGGKSSRMGQDKAFVEVAGQPLFDRVLAAFREVFTEIVLVGDRADRFAHTGLPVYPDRYPGSALGGLYSGLHYAKTPYVFVCACDVPYPSVPLIRLILAANQGHDVVVPKSHAGLEPLFALYGKNCLEQMRQLLEAGNFRVYDFYPAVNTRYLEPEEFDHLPDAQRSFLNLNTPAELAAVAAVPRLPVPAVSFVAKSGTGKTTLLEKVIADLAGRGYRVGVIKHDAHRFDIDHPGKDSHRLTAAGAATMLISSPEKLALVKQHSASPPIEELIRTYFSDVDLVLTEGFKKSGLAKIEVHRQERSPTLLCRGDEHDPSLLAVCSDEPLDLDVPVLDLNNSSAVADFLVARLLG